MDVTEITKQLKFSSTTLTHITEKHHTRVKQISSTFEFSMVA